MALFQYRGRNREGELVTGEREADSMELLAGQLSDARITPIQIDEVIERQNISDTVKKWLGSRQPKLNDMILFSRQMYALSKSGVPIIRGLRLVADSTRNEILANALLEIISDLESGQTLSGALARYPKIFSPLYVNIVRVGEETGNLDEAMLRLYYYLDADKVTIDKIKSALFYPATVLAAIVLAITFLMAKVIPKFAEIFERFDLDLPIQTRIIINISNFVADYWWLLLFVVISAFFGLRYYVNTDEGRYRWHRLKLRIPKIGDIILRATLARFARAFSMCSTAGVPILQGLTVVSRAVDNDYVEDKIKGIRNDIERGENLTRAGIATHMFTPLVIQMLQVGEETGRLDEMMQEVAEFYEREVAYDVQNISRIIEPLMTVVMGLLVMLLAFGIFLPMWDLVQITQR